MEGELQLPKIRLECRKHKEEEEGWEPVSPVAQYLNSSVLSISIFGVFELEMPIDDLQTEHLLNNVFLPISPRFSSIMVGKENTVKQWKRVQVELWDHVKVPTFPPGKSPEFYDKCLEDYLSKISAEQLPQSQPLWEVHLIQYPTSNAAGHVIIKLHHALGDGYSLMGALISCLKRADDPSLPLTLPTFKLRLNKKGESSNSTIFKRVPHIFYSTINSVSDFCWSIIKSKFKEDDLSPIRSGNADLRPISIATMTFSLHQIKQVKANLGVTINDAITGIIFYGTRLYMEAMKPGSSKTSTTSLILLNTRMCGSYTSLKEMVKPDTESPWGNHFAFLHVQIPHLTKAELSDPLEFIRKAQKVILAKKSSFGVYLTGFFLEALKRTLGPEESAKYVYGTLKNSSTAYTNMVGPEEKMSLDNHPIKSFYFMVAGNPQSLTITIVSYNGELRVALGAEKDFIDPQKLKSCIEKAFEIIVKAACKQGPSQANQDCHACT